MGSLKGLYQNSDRLRDLDQLDTELQIEAVEFNHFYPLTFFLTKSKQTENMLFSKESSMDRIIHLPKKQMKLLDFKKKQTFGVSNELNMQGQPKRESGVSRSEASQQLEAEAEANPFDLTLETLFSYANCASKIKNYGFANSLQNSPNCFQRKILGFSKHHAKEQIIEDLKKICHFSGSQSKNYQINSKEIFKDLYKASKEEHVREGAEFTQFQRSLKKSEIIGKSSNEIAKNSDDARLAESFREFRQMAKINASLTSRNKLNVHVPKRQTNPAQESTLLKISDLKQIVNQINLEIDDYLQTNNKGADWGKVENRNAVKGSALKSQSSACLENYKEQRLKQILDLKKKFTLISMHLESESASTENLIRNIDEYQNFCQNLSNRYSLDSELEANIDEEQKHLLEIVFKQLEINMEKSQINVKKSKCKNETSIVMDLPEQNQQLFQESKKKLSNYSKNNNQFTENDENTECKLNHQSNESKNNKNKIKNQIEYVEILIPKYENIFIYFNTFFNESIITKNSLQIESPNIQNEHFSELILSKKKVDSEFSGNKEMNIQKNMKMLRPIAKLNKIIKKYDLKKNKCIFKTNEIHDLNQVNWKQFFNLQKK